jgi:hypothetical protein
MWQHPKEATGEAGVIESTGVGGKFEDSRITLADGLGNQVQTYQVNAFHPSYALHHNPGHSCLRQLLLLEVAHACGLCRRDWNEEPWINQLRLKCASEAKNMAGKSSPYFRSIPRY